MRTRIILGLAAVVIALAGFAAVSTETRKADAVVGGLPGSLWIRCPLSSAFSARLTFYGDPLPPVFFPFPVVWPQKAQYFVACLPGGFVPLPIVIPKNTTGYILELFRPGFPVPCGVAIRGPYAAGLPPPSFIGRCPIGGTVFAGTEAADGEASGVGSDEPYLAFAGPPVGGISRDPGAGASPLESQPPSGPDAGFFAAVIAATTAGALVLGGGAWYVRRRRIADNVS